MISCSFSLVPFPALGIPNICINGELVIQKNLLALHYVLSGEVENVLLPSRSMHPGRKDELWKSTCFEFFLAIKDQAQYWEFNLSPSGDWNVYHMDAYRRIGFREESSIQRLPFETQMEAGQFRLDVQVDLNPMLSPGQPLEFGITAIIRTTEENESYWALMHPASAPDFHLRESFVLQLSEQAQASPQSTLEG